MALNNFDYILSWSDFIPVPKRPEGADSDALLHPIIKDNHYHYARNQNRIVITKADVTISLIKSECWVVTGAMVDSLLKHEQRHYDIAAIYAREFYSSVLRLSASSDDALHEKIGQLRTSFGGKYGAVQSRYDIQTVHSQNTAMQQTWDKQIAAEKQKPDGSIDNLPT